MPNALVEDGSTPIYQAAWCGHTEIVKILAPLTDNPNNSDEDGRTPIYRASWNGHTEIVKILVPLTYNPIKMEKLQFFGQQGMDIQKLSKYWPLS